MTTDAKKILKFVSLFILLLFIVVYAFFKSKDLIFGVRIEGVNLVDGANIEENVLDVKGVARNVTKLTLGGREISVDQKGNFHEAIALLSGYNTVVIRAEDKFGNKDEKIYQLIH